MAPSSPDRRFGAKLDSFRTGTRSRVATSNGAMPSGPGRPCALGYFVASCMSSEIRGHRLSKRALPATLIWWTCISGGGSSRSSVTNGPKTGTKTLSSPKPKSIVPPVNAEHSMVYGVLTETTVVAPVNANILPRTRSWLPSRTTTVSRRRSTKLSQAFCTPRGNSDTANAARSQALSWSPDHHAKASAATMTAPSIVQ